MKYSLILVAILLFSPYFGFGQDSKTVNNSLIESPSGVKYKFLRKGRGVQPKTGDDLYVHYIGRYNDTVVFADTYKRGFPLQFTFGIGQVIKGWEQTFKYLHQGDVVYMEVPPELGYGNIEQQGVPPNSVLQFEIHLMQVIPGRKVIPYSTLGKDTITTKSGLKYIIIEDGTESYPRDKELMIVDYTGFLENGKIFDSSIRRNKPLKFTMGEGAVLKSWEEGLRKIKEGGMIKLIIPPELAYGEKGFKNIVPPNETLTFDIYLIKTKPEIVIEPFNVKGIKKQKTSSGIKYFIIEEGEGLQPDTNSIVTVHYSGYFLTGKMFDSSLKRDEPIQFPLGAGAVIEGWDEAFMLFKEGTKARIFIPSKLAYGKEGNADIIPPNTNLIFDVELLKVINNEEDN